MRWIWALACGLTLLQGLSNPAFCLVGRCAADCPDERSNGDCPAACESCACCGAVRPVLLVRVAAPIPPGSVAWVWSESPPIVAAPDPREILHVPKPLA
jgi:hypothetical protein